MAETEVHLPDGRVVYFPASMSSDDVTKAMSSVTQPHQAAAKPAPPDNRSMLHVALDQAMDAPLGILPSMNQMFGGAASVVKNHPVETGAALGAGAMGLATGGLGFIPAVLAAGLGGAGGAGYGIAAKAAMDKPSPSVTDDLATMGKEGAMSAAGEGVGRGIIQPALTALSKGAYRYALQPTQAVLAKSSRSGNLIEHGLDSMTPVDASGIASAADRVAGGQVAKQTLLNDAGDAGVRSMPDELAANARRRLAGKATALKNAGEVGEAAQLDPMIGRFETAQAPRMVSQPPTVVHGSALPDSVEAAVQANNDLGGVAKNIPDAVFGGDNPAAVKAAREIGNMANVVPRRILGTSQFPAQDLTFGDGIPADGLKPLDMDALKQTWDDRLGPTFMKMKRKMPLTIREENRLSLRNAADDDLSQISGYKDTNRQINLDEQLRQAMDRRVNGSGANQGIEKALAGAAAFTGHPGALLGLLAAHPAVASRVAIGGYKTAQTPLLAALAAAASGGGAGDGLGDMLRMLMAQHEPAK